ncbi:hypothetical protein QZH41_001780 [Actinostola sp. cb2023]|nr:hypothetical protein QZH41_001780 [Actinostola sp. cb2023]
MMAKYSLRPHEKIDYKSLDSGILPDKTGGDVSGETNDEHDDDDHEEWEELMAQVAKEEKRKEELLQLNENAKRKQEKQELKEKIAKLRAENTDTESKLKDQKVTPKDLLAFEPLAKEVEKKLAKMMLADAAHEDSSGDESSGSSSSTEQEKCKAKREFGWPVGYLYDVYGFPISELRNHKGATTFPDELNKYLEEELSRGSVAGPFDSIPFSREVPNQQDAPNPPEGNNYLDNTSPSEYSGSEEESSSEDDEPSDKNEENNDLTDKTNVHNESPLTLSTIKEEIKKTCQIEITKLKEEIYKDHPNNENIKLRNENNQLQIENKQQIARFQELESRFNSLKQEAKIINEENKSLITALRLLTN